LQRQQLVHDPVIEQAAEEPRQRRRAVLIPPGVIPTERQYGAVQNQFAHFGEFRVYHGYERRVRGYVGWGGDDGLE
jgi:hypothetical protein